MNTVIHIDWKLKAQLVCGQMYKQTEQNRIKHYVPNNAVQNYVYICIIWLFLNWQ